MTFESVATKPFASIGIWIHACTRVAASCVSAHTTCRMARVRILRALVDVDADLIVVVATGIGSSRRLGTEARRACAHECAQCVRASCVWRARMWARRWQRCCHRALIDVATVEAISPEPCPVAFTRVPECVYRADSIDASCIIRACMSTFNALVNVHACDTIAREAWGTCAAEGARKVGAITGIEAVVRTRATFINLRARRRGAEVATHASACTVDKMRRVRRAGEAMVGCAAAASGAARVARAATAAGSGVIRRRADSEAGTAKELGRMDRTRSALARRATTAS